MKLESTHKKNNDQDSNDRKCSMKPKPNDKCSRVRSNNESAEKRVRINDIEYNIKKKCVSMHENAVERREKKTSRRKPHMIQ